MTLNDLQRKLQGDVWKHYKAWCRENAVAACGHRFSLIRFGKEAWNRAPELASCYKAFTVKQMIYWVHAYLMDTMPHSQHDLTRASYSMAKMQFNMDVSGPFLQEDIKADTVLMGRSFLLFYQQPCCSKYWLRSKELQDHSKAPRFSAPYLVRPAYSPEPAEIRF